MEGKNYRQHVYKGTEGLIKGVEPNTAHHVSAKVDAEDGHRSQGKRNTGDDEEEEGRDLWDVTRQCVCNGLLQVVKDETTYDE